VGRPRHRQRRHRAVVAGHRQRRDGHRDEVISQARVVGTVAGVPFAVAGIPFGERVVALLGAPPEVARLGGRCLGTILATAPAGHIRFIAARSLQGTGDTRTSMYVNVAANALDVAGALTARSGAVRGAAAVCRRCRLPRRRWTQQAVSMLEERGSVPAE
jgi:hypothetical protein